MYDKEKVQTLKRQIQKHAETRGEGAIYKLNATGICTDLV